MHTVATIVDDGVVAFDLGIPCGVFGEDRSDIVDPWYRFVVVAPEERRVRTQSGFVVEATHGLRALDRADTIVVPGTVGTAPSPRLLRALVRAHERGARIASICVGAFVLAEAGLLDGRRATTHWYAADALQRRFPQIDVDPDVLYIDDGDILTSAGMGAGIDLCLHMVACDHGAEVAAAVARRLVVPLHRSGGQAQFVDTPVSTDKGNGIGPLLEWAQRELPHGVSVDELARRAAMSPRTLTRRFRAATGLPPGEWLAHERLRLAQRLLETTDDAVELVARRAGYDSSVTMRAQFASRLRTSPRAYRRTFRG
jgi:AraC family transcriptional regulator, transcriptional activator FtrA